MEKQIEYIISVANKASEQPADSEEQNRRNLYTCINSKKSFKLDLIIDGDFIYFDPTEAINEDVYRLAVYPRLEHEEIRKMKEKFGDDAIKIFKLDLQ